MPPEPDRSLYTFYGSEIAAFNNYDVGNTWATVGYAVNGDAVDWSYGEQVEKNKIFAFTPEVGNQSDGFWPPSTRIFPLAEENLGPNLYWAWIAGARAYLGGAHVDAQVPAGGSGEVTADVSNFGLGEDADDVTLTLSTSDAFVTIPDPEINFPSIPSLETLINTDDPIVFNVSPAAPNGHVIDLDVTMKQGPVLRGMATVQTTVKGSAGVPGGAESPAIAHLVLQSHAESDGDPDGARRRAPRRRPRPRSRSWMSPAGYGACYGQLRMRRRVSIASPSTAAMRKDPRCRMACTWPSSGAGENGRKSGW